MMWACYLCNGGCVAGINNFMQSDASACMTCIKTCDICNSFEHCKGICPPWQAPLCTRPLTSGDPVSPSHHTAAVTLHTLLLVAVQPWYEVPFASRRNIVATMLLGTAAVWVWNKSELLKTGAAGHRYASRQQQHQQMSHVFLCSTSKASGPTAGDCWLKEHGVQQCHVVFCCTSNAWDTCTLCPATHSKHACFICGACSHMQEEQGKGGAHACGPAE